MDKITHYVAISTSKTSNIYELKTRTERWGPYEAKDIECTADAEKRRLVLKTSHEGDKGAYVDIPKSIDLSGSMRLHVANKCVLYVLLPKIGAPKLDDFPDELLQPDPREDLDPTYKVIPELYKGLKSHYGVEASDFDKIRVERTAEQERLKKVREEMGEEAWAAAREQSLIQETESKPFTQQDKDDGMVKRKKKTGPTPKTW